MVTTGRYSRSEQRRAPVRGGRGPGGYRSPTAPRRTCSRQGEIEIDGGRDLVLDDELRTNPDAVAVGDVTGAPPSVCGAWQRNVIRSTGRRAWRVRSAWVVFLVALALTSTACASGENSAGDPNPNGAGANRDDAKVIQLRSIAELQDRFNEDAGKIRLILLVSPT